MKRMERDSEEAVPGPGQKRGIRGQINGRSKQNDHSRVAGVRKRVDSDDER